MAIKTGREFLLNSFIQLLSCVPVLWHVQSPAASDAHARGAAPLPDAPSLPALSSLCHHKHTHSTLHTQYFITHTASHSKTETIWFEPQASLARLNSLLHCSLRVGSSTVQPSTVVHDLGLHLDNEQSMKQHVTKVAATCYYHLRRLRQIRQ